MLAQQRIGARLRQWARDQYDLLVRRVRIDADAPQCIEIGFDGMARRTRRQPVEVGERALPQPLVAQPLAGDVNGASDDFDAAFLGGGRVLVFARSDDVENAPIALWSAVREGARYVHPQRLDARINVDGGWILGPSDDPAQRDTLLFSGLRAGGQGLADIHSIHYRVR
jgi:hypothetical protein